MLSHPGPEKTEGRLAAGGLVEIWCESVFTPGLRPRNVLGLQSLWTFLHLEFHFATFVQSTVARHLDGGEVHEHVLTVGPLDETIALSGVKPFHDTFFSHCYISPGLVASQKGAHTWWDTSDAARHSWLERSAYCYTTH